MLGDFHLLDLLTERGTITDTVFTDNSDLLSALSLRGRRGKKEWTDEYLDSRFVMVEKKNYAVGVEYFRNSIL